MATFNGMLLVIGLSLIGLTSTVSSTAYQDCGSIGEVQELAVTDCDYPPCIVYRPNNYSIGIDFIAPKAADTLNTTLIAIVSSADVLWPAPSACDLIGDVGCPIQEGVLYPFLMTMQVKPEFPQISVLVRIRLIDEDDVDHVCVELPFTVV